MTEAVFAFDKGHNNLVPPFMEMLCVLALTIFKGVTSNSIYFKYDDVTSAKTI